MKIRYDSENHERFELERPSLAPSVAAVGAITQGGRTPTAAAASLAAVTRAANGSTSYGTRAVAGFPSPIGTPAERDPLDRLRELAELRDSGALTASEFETQKTKILAET
ncbi:MAG: SHOCT domain-containing protein [Solirubrobacteraceae bacterium]